MLHRFAVSEKEKLDLIFKRDFVIKTRFWKSKCLKGNGKVFESLGWKAGI